MAGWYDTASLHHVNIPSTVNMVDVAVSIKSALFWSNHDTAIMFLLHPKQINLIAL